MSAPCWARGRAWSRFGEGTPWFSVLCVSAILGELSVLCDSRSDGGIGRRRPAAGDKSLCPGGHLPPGLCERRRGGLGGNRRAWGTQNLPTVPVAVENVSPLKSSLCPLPPRQQKGLVFPWWSKLRKAVEGKESGRWRAPRTSRSFSDKWVFLLRGFFSHLWESSYSVVAPAGPHHFL